MNEIKLTCEAQLLQKSLLEKELAVLKQKYIMACTGISGNTFNSWDLTASAEKENFPDYSTAEKTLPNAQRELAKSESLDCESLVDIVETGQNPKCSLQRKTVCIKGKGRPNNAKIKASLKKLEGEMAPFQGKRSSQNCLLDAVFGSNAKLSLKRLDLMDENDEEKESVVEGKVHKKVKK